MLLWEAQAIRDETLVLFLFEREAWRLFIFILK